MPPRRREPLGTRELVWDIAVVCIWLIMFFWISHSSPLKNMFDNFTTSPASAAQSSPTPSAQSDLMSVRGYEGLGDGDINNRDVHDFDVVASLTNIADHPRRFLRARYVTTARVLSEDVTAPAFGRAVVGLMVNETADLEGWLMKDTAGICDRAMSGIRYNIASLSLQHLRCNLTGLARQHPLIEAGEEAGSKDSRCSPENVQNRDRLLRSLWDLGNSVGPACDEVQTTITSSLGTLHRFRRVLMSTAGGVISDLNFFIDVFATLVRADGDMNTQSEQLVQHLLHKSNMSGARLEVLASRAATRYPGDLDPFTALILHLVLGSSLVSSRGELFSTPPQYVVDTVKAEQGIPIRDAIRQELDWQAHTFNKTLDLLSSPILPGVREWVSLITEANKTDVFAVMAEDDNERIRRYEKNNPSGRETMAWMSKERMFWEEADSADCLIRGIDDGIDHLEFLTGYLAQLQSGVPGMLARLDDWDADVTKLAEELKLVLSSGRRFTAQERKQSRSEGDSRKATLDITRYQVYPEDLQSIRLGLAEVLDAFQNVKARVEDFNPQDSWQDNWFETEMHRWSRERAALRAEWEESRKPAKPVKPAKPAEKGFWERIFGS